MQKKNLNLLVLTGILGIASANASSTATITALKSPVWLQQDNSKTELNRSSILKVGDNIATGDAGRIEMQLWVNARLQLNANSEITIRAENEVDLTAADGRPELYIHQGRACISYTALSSREEKFVVNIGDLMFAAIHLHGDICVLRSDGLSSIKLRAGSVQVTHAADPNMMILSETGTEIHIEDNGSYDLLLPGTDQSSTLEIEKPFVIETVIEDDDSGDSVDTVDSNNAATEGSIAAAPGTTKQNEGFAHVYTVYLFSTGSAEVAERVNNEFQKAGYDTHIYEVISGLVSRYRIAVSGFESRQAATTFSDSVVGKLGITETWIGRDLR